MRFCEIDSFYFRWRKMQTFGVKNLISSEEPFISKTSKYQHLLVDFIKTIEGHRFITFYINFKRYHKTIPMNLTCPLILFSVYFKSNQIFT